MSTTGASDFLQGLSPSMLSKFAVRSNLKSDDWQNITRGIIAAMSREQLDTLPPETFSPVISELDNLDLHELDGIFRKVSDEPWVQEQYPDFWKDYLKATTDPNDQGNVVPGVGPGTAPLGSGTGGGTGGVTGGGTGDVISGVLLRQCVYVVCCDGHLDQVTIPTGPITKLVSGRLNKGERFPSPPHYGVFGDPIVKCPSDAKWQAHSKRNCEDTSDDCA